MKLTGYSKKELCSFGTLKVVWISPMSHKQWERSLYESVNLKQGKQLTIHKPILETLTSEFQNAITNP
jgi:hypothetical protein